jgi:hypothetical protein
MQDKLIKFETAKLAKDKGFDWHTRYFSDANGKIEIEWFIEKHLNISDFELKIPTQSLLQKWLREVHDIEVLISIFPKIMREKMNKEKYCGYVLNENWNPTVPSNGTFRKTYEEALEAGLKEALNLIK